MQSLDTQQQKSGCDREKQAYEPPKAACVRVQIDERVSGCNFSSVQVCGLTE
jgi:hypothetical protein